MLTLIVDFRATKGGKEQAVAVKLSKDAPLATARGGPRDVLLNPKLTELKCLQLP